MKVVVITGSTRGIGHGLADAFLALGCAVVVSGRTTEAVKGAAAGLASRYAAERVLPCACDVTEFEQVQALWDAAMARFGRVDIWINNAGIAHPQASFWTHSPERVQAVVQTNVVGAMYGAQVALRGMLAQQAGSFYNMEGLGSGGRVVKGLALYATTKAGLSYLTDALVAEMKGTPVVVGALQPGMVVTEMLTGQYSGQEEDWERAKRVFNLLADRVDTVAPWLAKKVLHNRRHGARFRWLTTGKLLRRVVLAPIHRRDLFA